MFINLIRVILVLWIVSVLLRWLRTPKTTGGSGAAGHTKKQANAPVDFGQTGTIDDAEYEEIDKN